MRGRAWGEKCVCVCHSLERALGKEKYGGETLGREKCG